MFLVFLLRHFENYLVIFSVQQIDQMIQLYDTTHTKTTWNGLVGHGKSVFRDFCAEKSGEVMWKNGTNVLGRGFNTNNVFYFVTNNSFSFELKDAAVCDFSLLIVMNLLFYVRVTLRWLLTPRRSPSLRRPSGHQRASGKQEKHWKLRKLLRRSRHVS